MEIHQHHERKGYTYGGKNPERMRRRDRQHANDTNNPRGISPLFIFQGKP